MTFSQRRDSEIDRQIANAEANMAEFVYDKYGSCVGRCWKCAGRADEWGKRHDEHHVRCPSHPDNVAARLAEGMSG
jgi:hypothetical protein